MRRILFSLMTLVLVVGLVGGGAFAWFSDIAVTQDNTFTAGTLNLEIYGSSWGDGPVTGTWVSPANWAPGETFTATVELKNVGTIDATYLAGDMHNYVKNGQGDGSSLADVIEVVTFKEYIPGYGWIDDLGTDQHYQTLVGDGATPLTLDELMKSYIPTLGEPKDFNPGEWCQDEFGGWVSHLTDWITGYGYDIVPTGTPAVEAGGTYKMQIGFKFMESAGNEYQGDTCQFDISFMAIQDLSQAP